MPTIRSAKPEDFPGAVVGPAVRLPGDQPKRMTFRLPWPPSVNHYWRHVGNRVLISAEGRKYRKAVREALRWREHHIDGRLVMRIYAYPPDRRRRDLDNLLKGLLDALQAAGVYNDDSQIDSLEIHRRPPVTPSESGLTVCVGRMEDEPRGE